jgi:hypothetical protein
MFEEQGPDDMKSEFPSCIEECFYSSLEGSYFKAELSKARDEKRIGLPLPYDPSRPVNFWDIGMDDENCIYPPDRRRAPPHQCPAPAVPSAAAIL